MNILEACADPKLLGHWLSDLDRLPAWRAFLAALFALPMSDEELDLLPALHGAHGAAGGAF